MLDKRNFEEGEIQAVPLKKRNQLSGVDFAVPTGKSIERTTTKH